MLSVHRGFVEKNKNEIVTETIERFAEDPRRLLFK